MSMCCKSLAYDGDVYFDCLEEFVVSKKARPGLTSGPGLECDNSSSGYSSDGDSELPDWQELAFEELGETPEVRSLIFNLCYF